MKITREIIHEIANVVRTSEKLNESKAKLKYILVNKGLDKTTANKMIKDLQNKTIMPSEFAEIIENK